MSLSVPDILQHININSDYQMEQEQMAPVRAKKRRLDHLSWEEKVQRKWVFLGVKQVARNFQNVPRVIDF